ncbi:MAG: hypothetical protein CM15mP32_6270 [Flavobacteriaceae bacterium]|nr:MAG: hypothetical protein CM15mP32_6270 [Flavobacteriaceae bacterium]
MRLKESSTPCDGSDDFENLVTVREGISMSDAEEDFSSNKMKITCCIKTINSWSIPFRDIAKVSLKPTQTRTTMAFVFAAEIGVTQDVLERCSALVNAGVDGVVIDTAHGHTQGVVDVLKKKKKNIKIWMLLLETSQQLRQPPFLQKQG